MKLTVKNVHSGPVMVHTEKGPSFIARGGELTADFSDAEAANMATNSLLDLGEKGGKKTGKSE